jgi:hypothetical protein
VDLDSEPDPDPPGSKTFDRIRKKSFRIQDRDRSGNKDMDQAIIIWIRQYSMEIDQVIRIWIRQYSVEIDQAIWIRHYGDGSGNTNMDQAVWS